jgi:predicted transcriptional regulator
METNKKYKNKLVENELTIRKADKEKSMVILTRQDYTQKVNNFI